MSMQRMRMQRRPSGRFFHLLAAVGALLAAGQSVADDRPFLVTRMATTEADNDNVWALDTVTQRLGGQNSAIFNAEYAFNPQTTAQLTATRSRGLQGFSVEFKRVFNSFAHDDWGWGLNVELGARKADGLRWQGGDAAVTLPLSWKVTDNTLLHASLGVEKERGQERQGVLALAAEWMLTRQGTLFAEIAQVGETRLAQLGLRWWLKREKLAVDLATVRARADGSTQRGMVLGLTLQDL